MAPAKRKPTDILTPTRRSARLSNKRTKMTTEKCDAEIEIKHEKEAARTRDPTVQVSHDCKEKLDELTRVLHLETLGSTIDILLPTTEVAKEITELSRDLGHDTGGKTIDWLLQQAEPTIAAILGRQDASTVMTGYSAAPPMHTPTFSTPQFSQNPQGASPFTFTYTGGLGTGSIAGYSSNLYPPAFTPTIFQRRSTGPVTAHRSDASTVIGGYPGAKEMVELSRDLGHDTGGQTIDWLSHQGEPDIAATRVGRQHESTVIAGYSTAPPMHAPPFRTPQFSQNPQAEPAIAAARVGRQDASTGYSAAPMHSPPFRTPQFSQNPQGVTSTGGLGTGSTAGYSSNHYPPAFSPTGGLRTGSSADTANVPEEKARDVGSRLKLSSIAIHKFLVDKTSSSEKSIREACGDSPDTSKALRELVKANKVQRLGRGGRADPYVYMVMLPLSDLELLKEGQATEPPDSIEQ